MSNGFTPVKTATHYKRDGFQINSAPVGALGLGMFACPSMRSVEMNCRCVTIDAVH
jgi:hypothetical protein